MTSIRKKLLALVLALVLGLFGAHNFYLGNRTRGGLQAALTCVGVVFLPWLVLFVAASVVVEIVLIAVGAGDYRGAGESGCEATAAMPLAKSAVKNGTVSG